MASFLWIFLPIFVDTGSALLAFCLMQARMEVALAQERAASADLRASVTQNERIVEERVKAAEEAAQRRALDQLLEEFRVEERHYVRESKSLFLNRKSMVVQERLFFRSIPLSNWIEHEMVVEEGGDLQQLAQSCSVFVPQSARQVTATGPKLIRSAGAKLGA